MDETLYPQKELQDPIQMNNMNMQEEQQQDMLNPQQEEQQQDMLNPQQEEEQQQDLLNTGMIMGKQEQQELQNENMTERLTKTTTAPMTSKSLNATAEANFQSGINSRPGPCDRRKTREKKANARSKVGFMVGLNQYSGQLSQDLSATTKKQAEQQRKDKDYYTKWENSYLGKETQAAYIENNLKNKDELQAVYAKKSLLLGYLKSDKNRRNLLSSSHTSVGIAVEELLDSALAFELQPNALCTLPATQRAAQVMEHATFVDRLNDLLSDNYTVPPYKVEQFKKFAKVFEHLKQGTEAVVHLQGVNVNGKNRYRFYEDMKLSEKWGMQNDRKSNKKQHERSSVSYEDGLKQYNNDYSDKEALTEQRLAYIKERTGEEMSEQDYDEKMDHDSRADEMNFMGRNIQGQYSKWQNTEQGKRVGKEANAVEVKIMKQIPLTQEEKDYAVGITRVSTSQIELNEDFLGTGRMDQLYGNDVKIRAAAQEKLLDDMLANISRLDPDPEHYINSGKDELDAVCKLFFNMKAMNSLINDDKATQRYFSAYKRDSFRSLYATALHLENYLSTEILMNWKPNLKKKLSKEDNKIAKEGYAEQYKQRVAVHNEHYDNSDEQSQQKIAKAGELLGTTLGVTKHTLDMAESLQTMASQPLTLGEFAGENNTLASEVVTQRVEAQEKLIDKLLQFPIDARKVLVMPDMASIPQIIAHGEMLDEANRQLAADKETASLLPADKLGQLRAYTEAFVVLRDTAAAVVDSVGLTVKGTSRYVNTPNMTPEQLAADQLQVGNLLDGQRALADVVCNDYSRQQQMNDDEKEQVLLATNLLGTSMGISKDSYQLATAVRGNKQKAEADSIANVQQYNDWKKSDNGKAVTAVQDKRDREKEDMHRKDMESANVYKYTEEEANLPTAKASNEALKLLHLVQGDDDKVNLLGGDPKQRAEVYVKIIGEQMVHELSPDLLNDPALTQRLPTLMVAFDNVNAIIKALGEDRPARKHFSNELYSKATEYSQLLNYVNSSAECILPQHGLTMSGDSVYKDVKELRDIVNINSTRDYENDKFHEYTCPTYMKESKKYAEQYLNKP